jgi:endosialidase-like protein
MLRLARHTAVVAAVALVALLAQSTPVTATSEVFLSNDVALSEVTYVIQFDTTVAGRIGKIRALLPSGSTAGNARLGRLTIADMALPVDQDHAALAVDPSNPDAVVAQITVPRMVSVGSTIRIELFNLNNPTGGSHAIEARTYDEAGALLEVAPPISFTVYDSGAGDITSVNAGTGLTGGGTSGDVTLSVDTNQVQARVTGSCVAGSSIRAIDASGGVVCQSDTNSGGTVVTVNTGSGLMGGPITNSGTISIPVGGVTSAHILDGTIGSADIDSAQVQRRVAGSCPSGQAIRVVNADGTVGCQNAAGGVTNVTASAPLVSSGGVAPNISLPGVIINGGTTAIGQAALKNNAGFSNTASGASALFSNTTGSGNTAIGVSALQNNTTGNDNTATGIGALQANTTGFSNTASGALALSSNTTGSDNTATGDSALQVNTTGFSNTASGAGALFLNTTGSRNTASGAQALFSNTEGTDNTATGGGALRSNTTGTFNTASGSQALFNSTTGSGNAATGAQALFSNTTGFDNTASGAFALLDNTTGSQNTATGAVALLNNTTGANNTASGQSALFNNTIGGQNTASGGDALYSNTTGSQNTATGNGALANNTVGFNNTGIGAGANVAAGDLFNATAIGANAVVDASNKIRLGDTNVAVIEAQVGLTVSSDKTKKENFRPVDGDAVLTKIQGLTLTSWNFIGHDPKKFRHYGPMAQDFFAAFGHDGIGTIGTPTTITSTDMAGILMIAAQALEKRSAQQRQEIDALKARIQALEHLLGNRAHASASAGSPE